MAELKPCPFCGGDAKTEVSYLKYGGDDLLLKATVYCGECRVGKSVKFNALCKSFDEYIEQFKTATDIWNERAYGD